VRHDGELGQLLMLSLALVFLVVIIVLLRLARSQDRVLLRYASFGLLLHICFSFAQDWVYSTFYAGVSDVYHFADIGAVLARAMDLNFSQTAPEVLKMFLHLEARLPMGWITEGSSTSSTEALTGFLFYAFGQSLLLCFIAVGIFVWFGQLLLAFTLRELVHDDERKLAYASTFLVPSVIFWSSGITKEAFVFLGVTLLCHGAYAVSMRRFRYISTLAIGAVFVGVMKAYTLFPMAVAVGVWVLVSRSRGPDGYVRLRLLPMLMAATLVLGGVLLMGRIFPDFSLQQIGATAARQQTAWVEGASSSDVEVGSSSESLATQVPFIPLALVNSLFRPFAFESRSLTAFAASVETTLLLVVVLFAAFRFRLRAVRRAILGSPLIAASLAFTLLFGMGVGLVTRNLGSLSRYRMPMIPFYVLAVLLLIRRLRVEHRVSVSVIRGRSVT
jgi:hypothetical protein